MAWTSLMPSATRMALAFSFWRSSCIIQWQLVLRALAPFCLQRYAVLAFVRGRTQIPEQLVQTPCLVGLVQPLDWTFTWNAIYAKQVWSWIRQESRSLVIPACKPVLLWGPLRESIFQGCVTPLCLQSVNGSAVWIQTWRAPMPTFWHYKLLTIMSVHQCNNLFVLAACKLLWLHWVLALAWDMLKVCNPLVHKLSWLSSWDWQHFGNHLSCPCATCALTLAWFDCHCYRCGMNLYRSPRVKWYDMIWHFSCHFISYDDNPPIRAYNPTFDAAQVSHEWRHDLYSQALVAGNRDGCETNSRLQAPDYRPYQLQHLFSSSSSWKRHICYTSLLRKVHLYLALESWVEDLCKK